MSFEGGHKDSVYYSTMIQSFRKSDRDTAQESEPSTAGYDVGQDLYEHLKKRALNDATV